MYNLFLVMIGGAVGTAARYLVGKAWLATVGPGYPWGTLTVNLVGGLLMGLLAGSLARFGQGGETIRVLLATGVLGGFTTFSAFSLEVMTMIERNDWSAALGYALISVIGAVGAVALGLWTVRSLA